jgi:serine/threonine protein kinase
MSMLNSNGQKKESKRMYSISQTGGPSSINCRPTKVMGSVFMIDSRYEIMETLGSGAYGVVVSARDNLTGEMVAIKKIEKAFEHSTFTKRTLRELKIMRLLNHDNVININSIQLPRSREEFDEIYVITELMETDLSSIIKSPQPLSDEHCQFFMYQILRGMKYMHSACILHRDLKPRNLLVNSDCDLKICDFGLARAALDWNIRMPDMTDYVATRWYRAPEVILAFKKYSSAMDVWSAGCILGELLLRKPLLPGSDVHHQIELIFNLIGTPSDEDIEIIPNPRAREKVRRMPKRKGKPFELLFRDANPLSVDLLKKMLIFNPDKRITIDEALTHPYLESLHCPEDEPITNPVSRFDFDFERQLLTMRDLKDLIFEEILMYHFPQKKFEYEQAKQEFDNHFMAGRNPAQSPIPVINELQTLNT